MSTSIEDGGPAFPETHVQPNGKEPGWHGRAGMTLRDYFAAKALQGYLASYANPGAINSPSPMDAAKSAYRYADAMLEARKQK